MKTQKDTQKWRAVVIQPNVKLPALSTEVPEREYTFCGFLQQWVLEAPKLHEDNDNLPAYFEWDDVLSKFLSDTDKELAAPPVPTLEAGQKDLTLEQIEKYKVAVLGHTADLDKLRVGRIIYLTEESFQAGLKASKAFLDGSLEKKPVGNQLVSTLAPAYGPRVLRHYHALSQSQAILETDIPKLESSVETTPN
jgi:hypothetical protein